MINYVLELKQILQIYSTWVIIKDFSTRIVKLVLEHSLKSCDPMFISSHDAFVMLLLFVRKFTRYCVNRDHYYLKGLIMLYVKKHYGYG